MLQPAILPLLRHVLLVGAVAASASNATVAAQSAKPVSPEHLANAILQWVHAFENGRLDLSRPVRVGSLAPSYVRLALRSRALGPDAEAHQFSSYAILQQLVAAAEGHTTRATTDALVALAASGFAGDMFDHRNAMVRELGHFTLLRMDAPAVWSRVHEIATTKVSESGGDQGDQAVEGDDDRPAFDVNARTMWRVAAIRLLGLKEQGVFRSSIEECLTDDDARVRLAGAEALGFLRQPESLMTVTRVLSGEEHPMVAFALVRAAHRTLDKHADEIEAERSDLVLRTSLGRLGKAGWRTDMAIVRLIQSHPIAEAVQPLIALMRNARGQSDPILKIINKNASLLLSAEAHVALRRITRALVPEDPDQWQAFWNAERDNVVVKRTVKLPAGRTVSTMKEGGGFFGIPVLGSNVVFVLDTSGSMKEKVKAVYRGPLTGSGKPTEKKLRGSRLRVARYQTLKAVQSMPENSRFSIVTFSGNVRAWNSKPVRARSWGRDTAYRILGRLRPKGGTNVFDALVHVLRAKDAGYGQATQTPDEVFVLSDGMPSSGELTGTEEILEAVAKINEVRGIRINTVFAGEGDGAGAAFMRRLAEENGGVFVQQ